MEAKFLFIFGLEAKRDNRKQKHCYFAYKRNRKIRSKNSLSFFRLKANGKILREKLRVFRLEVKREIGRKNGERKKKYAIFVDLHLNKAQLKAKRSEKIFIFFSFPEAERSKIETSFCFKAEKVLRNLHAHLMSGLGNWMVRLGHNHQVFFEIILSKRKLI